MELLENISEYYDELFPVSDSQKTFFEREFASFSKPVKYLSICCGSGLFEHYLANNGVLVTGIESIHSLIESANRRRRTQLTTLNFFEMSILEIARYLGKKFYNVISILNNRIIFINDDILLEKFFFDCKQLLSEKGKLIISFPNFENIESKNEKFPIKESIRVKLFSEIETNSNNEKILTQTLETGNGKLIPTTTDAKINILTEEKIKTLAKKVGFSKIEFINGFLESDNSLIAIIS